MRHRTVQTGFGDLKEISYLADKFEMKPQTVIRWLRSMDVPLVYIANTAWFNYPVFERALFVLTRPGSPGFAAPGSKYKDKHLSKIRNKVDKPLISLPDDMKEVMENPSIVAEMAASSGRDPALAGRTRRTSSTSASKKEDTNAKV